MSMTAFPISNPTFLLNIEGIKGEQTDFIPRDPIEFETNRFLSMQETISMKHEGRYFPVFEQIPDDRFLDDWRGHIAATGCPEDFDHVSTTKPTQFENIVLLSEEIVVPIKLRPDGERVPCPFCTPGSPKFIRGRMAHFPDEKAVRFIGHRCAATHYGENYQQAETAYKRQNMCREYIKLWKEIGPRYGDLVQFLDLMANTAGDIQFVRDALDEQAPGYASFLHGDLAQTKGELFVKVDLGGKDRNGNAVIQQELIGTAAGLSFLTHGYNVALDVRRARSALATGEDQLPDWAPSSPEHPSTNEILKRGRLVEKALQRIPGVLAEINDGLLFLQRRNIALIHQWGNRMDNPYVRFEIKIDDRQLRVRSSSIAGDYYANVIIPAGAKLTPTADIAPEISHLMRMVA